MDLRTRARVPYGYKITDGKAYVDEEEAKRLTLYFRKYMEGASMSAAARIAKLPCSQSMLPELLRRKEYAGTDFYPPIITEEYQRALMAMREKRKSKYARKYNTHPKKGVRVYRDFWQAEARQCGHSGPADCAAALYQQIRPR